MGTFRFKRFAVCDDGAAMKVGTDAVLLGSWVTLRGAQQLLDIGTGSGVIALMLAQRSDPTAHVDAVELLDHDARQAQENVSNSPWASKVTVIQSAIQQYQPRHPYDLIVSNPPFFAGSLLPPDESRTKARHDVTLTQNDLVSAAARLLNATGTWGVIIPALSANSLVEEALAKKLQLHRITHFITRPGKKPERTLMEFRWDKSTPFRDELILYDSKNQWSHSYRKITGDFYLD